MIIVKLLVFDVNILNHKIMCKLFVLDRNTRYYVTNGKKLLNDLKNGHINVQWKQNLLRKNYSKI